MQVAVGVFADSKETSGVMIGSPSFLQPDPGQWMPFLRGVCLDDGA